MDAIDLEEARQEIPGATHTELMALAYELVARALKSEALAEERGRVIENVRAIADRFNEDRHAHVGQVVAALWKALTPEPAKEARCGCGHDLEHHEDVDDPNTACDGDFPGGAKCGCFGWNPGVKAAKEDGNNG